MSITNWQKLFFLIAYSFKAVHNVNHNSKVCFNILPTTHHEIYYETAGNEVSILNKKLKMS